MNIIFHLSHENFPHKVSKAVAKAFRSYCRFLLCGPAARMLYIPPKSARAQVRLISERVENHEHEGILPTLLRGPTRRAAVASMVKARKLKRRVKTRTPIPYKHLVKFSESYFVCSALFICAVMQPKTQRFCERNEPQGLFFGKPFLPTCSVISRRCISG